MLTDIFEKYAIRGGHREVEGWIEEGALSFLMMLDAYQMQNSVEGAVAEIGVHHGRCFTALSALRRDDEMGVAVDIFERQELNPDGSGHGDYDKFLANLVRHGVSDRQTVLRADSLTLTGPKIAAAAGGQPVRLFSVDGSHTAKHTTNDLQVAAEAIAASGIVILDDWYNPDWPGVQEGLFAFMRRRGCKLAPFAYGDGKLYLSMQAVHGAYFNYTSETIRPLALHWKQVMLVGFRCHHLSLPGPGELSMLAAGNDVTLIDLRWPAPYTGSLEGGWGTPETWGRWTVGPTAAFTIKIPPGESPELELRMHLASFFSDTRPRQVVAVSCGGSVLGEWPVETTEFAWKELTFVLPNEIAGPMLTFTLTCLATQSPKMLALSDDERELGVRVSTILLRRTSSVATTLPLSVPP